MTSTPTADPLPDRTKDSLDLYMEEYISKRVSQRVKDDLKEVMADIIAEKVDGHLNVFRAEMSPKPSQDSPHKRPKKGDEDSKPRAVPKADLNATTKPLAKAQVKMEPVVKVDAITQSLNTVAAVKDGPTKGATTDMQMTNVDKSSPFHVNNNRRRSGSGSNDSDDDESNDDESVTESDKVASRLSQLKLHFQLFVAERKNHHGMGLSDTVKINLMGQFYQHTDAKCRLKSKSLVLDALVTWWKSPSWNVGDLEIDSITNAAKVPETSFYSYRGIKQLRKRPTYPRK